MSKASRLRQHTKLARIRGITPEQAQRELSEAYWAKRRQDWKQAAGPVYAPR